MTLVISGLYLGNIYDAKDENWLKRHGVTHIINAAEEVPNFYMGIFKYTNLNMKDNPQEVGAFMFEKVYKYIDRIRSSGGVILIHCLEGVNRSASVILYYIMRKFNVDYRRAFSSLYKLRPIINPYPIYRKVITTTAYAVNSGKTLSWKRFHL